MSALAPEAAPSPAAAAAAAGIDLTDVTRATFYEVLPVIRSAIQEATFVSFDAEMTGLFLDHHRDEYLDEAQDRYTRVREAAQQYTITQVGVSCWRLLPDGGYEATTFNAYTYPEHVVGEAGGWAPPRRFLADAGSLSFLANHGFDFNTWIRNGVPFLPLRVQQDRLEQFDRATQQSVNGRGDNGNGGGGGRAVVIDRPEDVAYVNDLVTKVCTWLAGSQAGLVLPRMSSYQRLLAYQELGRPRQWSAGGAPVPPPPPASTPPPPTTASPSNGDVAMPDASTPAAELLDPGFFVSKVDIDGWKHIRLVRGSREAAAAAEAAERAARRAALVQATGFSEVLRVLQESGKPAVGHNALFDLAYLISCFCYGPVLPARWEDFRELVAQHFPGGVYDTKQLARALPAEVVPLGTGLGDLFASLTQPGPARDAAQALLLKHAAAAGSSPAGTPTSLPAMRHAPYTRKYSGVNAGGAAHEAGYDAYMTGACFACLAALTPVCAPANNQSAGPAQGEPAHTAGPLAPLLPWAGRINIARTDMPYLAVTGPEPELSRPLVLHMSGGPAGARMSDVLAAVAAAGLPVRPRITPLPLGAPVPGFLIELSPDCADWDAPRLSAGLAAAQPADAPATWRVQSWVEYCTARQVAATEAAAAVAAGTVTGDTPVNKRARVDFKPPTPPAGATAVMAARLRTNAAPL